MNMNKIILITAGALIVAGAAISAVPIFHGITTVSMEDAKTVTQTVTEDISKIKILSDADDIRIVAANTDSIKLTYTTGKTKDYEFSAENGELLLSSSKSQDRKWYDYINFNFNNELNKILIVVPENFSADMELNLKYGDIYVGDLKGNMSIQADCGDVDIERCEFGTLDCDLDYGDIEIRKTLFENTNIKCDYGDIEVERISGDVLVFENDCGDIKGTIVGNEADYTIDVNTNLGDKNIQSRQGGSKTLNAKTDYGDIKLGFIN